MPPIEKKKTLLLIDSFALIFRAYYAFPPTLTTADGEIINAAFGFTTLLLDVLKKFEPTNVVAVFDPMTPIIRQNDFLLYKANRKETAPELSNQIPRVRDVLEAFNIPVLKVDGYEADDVIATIDKKHSGKWAQTIVVTGDRDLFQLVDDDTFVYLAGRKFSESKLFDHEGVIEKMGIRPDQVVDYKAICGDASDNIPGVNGIGDKGAITLVKEFESLENIYENIENVPNRYKKKLQEGIEIAFKSKQLATLEQDVPITFNFDSSIIKNLDLTKIFNLFETLQFRSQRKKVEDLAKVYSVKESLDLFAAEQNAKPDNPEFDIKLIDEKTKEVFLLAEFLDIDKNPLYWNFKELHIKLKNNDQIFKVNDADILDLLTKLAKSKIRILTINSKEILHAFYNLPENIDKQLIHVLNFFDVGFAGFLLGEGLVRNKLEAVFDFLRIEYNHGNYASNIEKLPEACQILEDRFEDDKSLKEVLRLETSLLPVVVEMERNGITLDIDMLNDLEAFMEQIKAGIVKEVYADVGHEFNINSPKQVGEILFRERNLPGNSKTKTGEFSTNERILSKLVDVDPVAKNILRYREVDKLLSTYVKPLPGYVYSDGKIHAIFDQFGAVSGRFASRNPNLQNIPLENSFELNIRDAFVASKDSIFIAFDYSQQELRILAALAKEEKLIESFNKGEDIHKLTASKIFGKKMEEITKSERHVGKTINFSVIYGISAFGLADRMNIDRDMAKIFIDKYFEEYPKISEYFENMKKEIAVKKVAKTILGRSRRVNMINANRFAISAVERELINFRIQGSAADIMKIAMLKMQNIVDKYPVKLLLQVHDEFVFEYAVGAGRDLHVPDNFVSEVRDIMNNALDIGVKYDVSVKIGERWGSLKEMKNGNK